ncbi:hypothetical protein OUZ56_012104 [Daphnia magna]|uniref:Reverse transcriptase RNase H-like domain-containing protein n=1 Tax=Daphnia magna TaxID=35525 RepID=A0ABQ9Z2D1_9CRUS|nr:hypothetical protein OUZ56_012104 [Daphnia magna]
MLAKSYLRNEQQNLEATFSAPEEIRAEPKFELITDHKPLVPILNDDLDKLHNPRILRLRFNNQKQPYECTARWLPGKNAQRSVASSPAQMMLNRPIRDPLPANYCSFVPKWQQETDTLEKKNEESKRNPNGALQSNSPSTIAVHL